MEVTLIKENKDGSADYNFDMTQEEQALLLRWAIVESLKRSVEEGKKYVPSETNLDNTGR